MANPARFTASANLGRVGITTTSALVKSDGSSLGTGNDLMFNVFTAGAYDSYLERVRFQSVANTPTSSVATTLRVFISTVADPTLGTANTNTFLLAELSVPIIASSNPTNATQFFDVPIDMVIPAGSYVHVSQHNAQTANQRWQALAIGGDYAAP